MWKVANQPKQRQSSGTTKPQTFNKVTEEPGVPRVPWTTTPSHTCQSTNGTESLEWERITSKAHQIYDKRANLSTLALTQSETNLFWRGLNFYPTQPPPKQESVNKDNDAFARRLNLKEYHTPDEMEQQLMLQQTLDTQAVTKRERVRGHQKNLT